MRQTPTVNTLYYGDNLRILRDHIASESVDLVYLDPPFNSNATYNVLFRSPTGEQSQAQIEAFEDSWHWNLAAQLAFDEVIKSAERTRFVSLCVAVDDDSPDSSRSVTKEKRPWTLRLACDGRNWTSVLRRRAEREISLRCSAFSA